MTSNSANKHTVSQRSPSRRCDAGCVEASTTLGIVDRSVGAFGCRMLRRDHSVTMVARLHVREVGTVDHDHGVE